jgi:pyruvate dehydrogenase E1 component beta subunit
MVQLKAFDYLDAPIKRISGADVPFPFSMPLLQMFLPDVKKIIDATKASLYIA